MYIQGDFIVLKHVAWVGKIYDHPVILSDGSHGPLKYGFRIGHNGASSAYEYENEQEANADRFMLIVALGEK